MSILAPAKNHITVADKVPVTVLSEFPGWFVGRRAAWFIRLALIAAALFMIQGGLLSDAIGIAIAAATFAVQKFFSPDPDAPIPIRGAD